LRIFFEWSWGMFFPSDITHLRFTRSAEVQSEDQKHHAEADAQALFLVSNQAPADQPLKHAQR
jgi:NADH dehydrogenase